MAKLVSLVSSFWTILLLLYCIAPSVYASYHQSFLTSEKTYDELYQEGMKAYSQENWKETIDLLEKAIAEFKFYRHQLTSCRIKCNNISKVSFPNANELIELTFFESIFFQAECLRRCKFQNLGNRPETINQEVTEKFLGKLPYNYLQFAYYKSFQTDKAMSAAYTYLQANPQDEVMKSNLEYYQSISHSKEAVVDLEQEPHQAHFRKGLNHYKNENWTGVIEEMENAVIAYWTADLECRALCEGKYDDREFLDLYESISNHYASTLHCKESCEASLATFEEAQYDNYLPQHFHFLQFAYFKVGDLGHATQNALSYLLFSPNDEVMKSNMRYYLHVGSDDDNDVTPREDVELFLERKLLEKKMLVYARLKFWGEDEGIYDDPYEKPIVKEYMEEDDNNKEIEELIERGKHIGDTRDKYKEYIEENEEDDEDTEGDGNNNEDIENEKLNSNSINVEDKKDGSNLLADSSAQSIEEKQEGGNAENLEGKKSNNDVENKKIADKFDDKKENDISRSTNNKEYKNNNNKKIGEINNDKKVNEFDDKIIDETNIDEKVEPAAETTTILEPVENKSSSRKERKKRKAAALVEGVKIVDNAASLNGENRVVADSLTSQDECQILLDLAQMNTIGGNGYDDDPNPHTPFEKFEGLPVLPVAMNARAKKIPHAMAQAYLDLSERARVFTESYFNLTKPLYHSYTHLVCRTAEPDAPANREDLSHPVHADNCQLDAEGNCHKVPPAFVWRDWSAIMYLGDDFQGGEFVFSNNKLEVQSRVKPKCGRIVAFSAGEENLHGVLPVLSGRRCAMALWFTHDLRYMELNRYKAQKILSSMLEEKKRKTEL